MLEEFRRRSALLRAASIHDISGRLAALLTWLEEQPVIRKKLDELRNSVDAKAIFPQNLVRVQRPQAHTPQQIAFVGLRIAEIARSRKYSLWRIARGLGLDLSNKHPEAVTDATMREYVWPLLDELEQTVLATLKQPTPTHVVETRFANLLTCKSDQAFPCTFKMLNTISQEFGRDQSDNHWHNIGNSCRHAFEKFAEELSERWNVTVGDPMQKGNVKGIVKACLRATPQGRFTETLISLLESVWDHCASILHRPTTTREEAERAFSWVSITIAEFARITPQEMVESARRS